MHNERPCPACCSEDPSTRLGHVVQGVYDGVLFWSCASCGYAWSRDFGDRERLNVESKRAAVMFLAPVAP